MDLFAHNGVNHSSPVEAASHIFSSSSFMALTLVLGLLVAAIVATRHLSKASVKVKRKGK